MGIGSIFDFLMIFFHDRVKNFYDDDKKEEKKELEDKSNSKLEMCEVNPMYISDPEEDIVSNKF